MELCLDHWIMFIATPCSSPPENYHQSRNHLSLGKDSPQPRPIQPVEVGRAVAVHWSVGFTTATNDAPPEQTSSLINSSY